MDNSFSEISLLQKLPDVNRKSCQLKDALIGFESFFIEHHGKAIESFQAKRTIQDDSQKAIATVKVTPTFVCNSVLVKEVAIVPATPKKASSDSEMPGTSTGDIASEEKMAKKVTRNTSNGSKRKVRLRRMGSRQSSKTESDTDDDQATNSDAARKVKRKTSRAKKQLESDKSFDSFQGDDEVVYVFKIKPGEKNEITVKPSDIIKASAEESILTSPTENSVQIVEPTSSEGVQQAAYCNAIVRTRRKIFTPIDVEGGMVNTTISQEIESSASDKNDSEKLNQKPPPSLESEAMNHARVSTLPPLPSPKFLRKNELTKQNSGKDLSPSIRLMIDRYNSTLDKNSNSPNSSGSCSPIWRSPIMDRRVRKQSTEYQTKILKSNSSQDVDEVGKSAARNGQETLENSSASHNESSTETLIEPKEEESKNKGAIPKNPKVLETSLSSETMPDVVIMRGDSSNKPRTPLSERALKIKQAKEAFLKMPLLSQDSGHSDWSYRLSQISVGSTDSNTDNSSILKCFSAGVLGQEIVETDDSASIVKSSSLPRTTKGLGNDSETASETSKSSRFGLSSLATKLRKVKLKRNTKEVNLMNTVPVLCRMSLAVDFTPSGSEGGNLADTPQKPSRFRKNKHDNIKKSKSLGILDN